MREIKFRAWHKKHNEIYDVISLKFDYDGILESAVVADKTFYDQRLVKADDLIVEQCTGVKDRKGKEIFEGDIISMRYPRDRRYFTKFIVLKDPRSPRLVFSDERISTELFDLFNDMHDYYEVIGNIHNDPELLNKDQPNEEE